jgi:hypothetical protein
MAQKMSTQTPIIVSIKKYARQSWSWLILVANGDDSPLRERALAVLGFIAVFGLVLVSIWGLREIPRRQVDEIVKVVVGRDAVKAFELENEARKTLTQIILGCFGLVVLYFAWRRVRANDRSVWIQQQGHITDRYTKAIEQLGKVEEGKPNIEVRLGAIYALERIAQDSPRDHWTIIEVLSAYVRRNAPAPELDKAGNRVNPPTPPRTDIQAVLTVIGRRRRNRKREQPGRLVDLSQSDLSGANLTMEAHLEGALLMDAHLEGAHLWGAHLEHAALLGAHLEGAKLQRAHLEGAALHLAYLERADLTGAHLEGAHLPLAHLEGALLVDAHLEGVDLRGANLERAVGLSLSQVKTALYWERASFSPGFLDEETGGKHDDGPEKDRSEPPERPEVHGAEDS